MPWGTRMTGRVQLTRLGVVGLLGACVLVWLLERSPDTHVRAPRPVEPGVEASSVTPSEAPAEARERTERTPLASETQPQTSTRLGNKRTAPNRVAADEVRKALCEYWQAATPAAPSASTPTALAPLPLGTGVRGRP